ncbi:MAG: DMT family transporter [Chloroflexota bacterium]|nr:DMT family transporter [Chloroflexota bacterium]
MPALAVVLAASLWSTIGTAYGLYDRFFAVDGLTIVTIRAAVATAILTTWLLARDRNALVVAPADLPRFIAYGLVSVTAFYVVLIYSFQLTSVAVGTLLLYLAPAFVTLGAGLLFGDRLTGSVILALVAAFAGCLLIVEAYRPANLSANALGIALGIASALCYAAFSLIGKPLVARYRLVTVVFWYLATGLAGLVLVKLIVSPTTWPPLREVVVIGGYSGVFNTLLPVMLYAWGLRCLPPAEASILATVEPVFAMALAAAILDERLAWPQIGGAMCIIAGIAALALTSAHRRDAARAVIRSHRGRQRPVRSEIRSD